MRRPWLKKIDMKRIENQNPPHVYPKYVVSKTGKKKPVPCKICNPPKAQLPAGMRRIKIRPYFVRYVRKEGYVPQILLKGEWLRKIGFDCGHHVLILESSGRLLISIDRDEQSS